MRVIATIIVAALVSWAAWHGCSTERGGAAREAGGGPPGGGGGAGGGGAGGSGAELSRCPAAAPVGGEPCAPAGRLCTYGAAPRGDCRDRATCVGDAWAVRAAGCAAASAKSDCPAAAPAGAACTKDGQLCAYPGGTECVCVSPGIGWQCDTPRSPGPDCPATPPNAGTPCTWSDTGSTSCTYACGLLSTNAIFARCAPDGAWTWALMPCTTVNRGF